MSTGPVPATGDDLDDGRAGRLVALDSVRPSQTLGHAARSPAVRLLIADGHALARAGLRMLLERDGQTAVVGEAATGEEAVALARRIRPAVVLMDAGLPGLDSVEATRMLAESGIAVMLLTTSESDERIFAALRAGASGLMLKDTEPGEVAHGVQALAQGQASLSPGLTRRLIEELVSRPEPTRPTDDVLDELTAREREVMTLVAPSSWCSRTRPASSTPAASPVATDARSAGSDHNHPEEPR
jgi:DNA-binding NarL/FixJ family response regulator